jgi:hypothetical protein
MKKNGSKWSRNDESTQKREGKENNMKNTSRTQRAILPPNPGGHKEDSGPPFSLEILVLTQITRIGGPLSHKHLRGGETLTRMKENTKWRR